MVEDDGENGLGSAGVLDGLRGEEEAVVCGRAVVGAVLGTGGGAGLAADPFEEEYDAVDWTNGDVQWLEGGFCEADWVW